MRIEAGKKKGQIGKKYRKIPDESGRANICLI